RPTSGGQRREWPLWPAALADAFRPAGPPAAMPKPVEALGRTVYDVQHEPRPWGWRVGAYLWTKSVAAGAALLAVAAVLGEGSAGMLGLPLVAIVFLLLTTFLLVIDLKRPERFHYILLKSNPRSWLVLGAVVLLGFGAALVLWTAAAIAGAETALMVLAVPLLLLALGAA